MRLCWMLKMRRSGRERAEDMSLSRLGKVALSAVIVGAAGSFLLMLRAGHSPLLLRVLFAGWVLSPFVALVLAIMMAKRWPLPTQTALHLVMLILSRNVVFWAGTPGEFPWRNTPRGFAAAAAATAGRAVGRRPRACRS